MTENCPNKLDKKLYENGLKNIEKFQDCMIDCTFDNKISLELIERKLSENYHFIDIDHDILPDTTPLEEQKENNNIDVIVFCKGNIKNLISVYSEEWIKNIYYCTPLDKYAHIMD